MTSDASWRGRVGPPFTRVSRETLAAAARFGAATLHEAAGQRGALPSAIKPVGPDFRLCGPAVTVLSPPADNLWLHRAIYVAEPGDVLVIETGGHHESGYWGEIMSHAAIARGLGGVVIDGCARDGAELRALGLPVFARGLCIRGTAKDRQAIGAINHPIRIGDVVVSPGDLVLGDGDGVVVIPCKEAATVVAAAAAREQKEANIIKELAAGRSTLEIYGFDR